MSNVAMKHEAIRSTFGAHCYDSIPGQNIIQNCRQYQCLLETEVVSSATMDGGFFYVTGTVFGLQATSVSI